MESEIEEVLDLGGLAEVGQRGIDDRPVYLVGRLCCDKSVNLFALMEVMKKAFRTKGKMTVRDWGGGLLVFSFESRTDRDWVLRNQPWHFDNYLFAITPLSAMELPSTVSLSTVSLWVRVSEIPFAFQSEAVIRSIAAKIGVLECYERPDALVPSRFLHFKVSFDYTKPLLQGLYVRFAGEPIWIAISYESLPVFCFGCGIIGHHYRNCKDYDRDAPTTMKELKYGNALRVPTGRNIGSGALVFLEKDAAELLSAPPSNSLNITTRPTTSTPNTHSHLIPAMQPNPHTDTSNAHAPILYNTETSHAPVHSIPTVTNSNISPYISLSTTLTTSPSVPFPIPSPQAT
ncbi:hypothetical protein ACS0TY_025139 [Phlomoides rotata]